MKGRAFLRKLVATDHQNFPAQIPKRCASSRRSIPGAFQVHAISNYSLLAWTLSVLFGAIGCVHLAGPRFLRNAYDRWEYSQKFRFIVGCLEIIAAGWLADPAFRLWGIGLAAIINFGAVITLLSHSQYVHAAPSALMMIALLPATLAVPRAPNPAQFTASVQSTVVLPQNDVDVTRYDSQEERAGG
jgi:hypothetical protein